MRRDSPSLARAWSAGGPDSTIGKNRARRQEIAGIHADVLLTLAGEVDRLGGSTADRLRYLKRFCGARNVAAFESLFRPDSPGILTAEYQRRGVGAALMGGLEEWGRRNGCTAVDLGVFEGNDGALRLFEESGYRFLEHRMARDL